MCNVAVIDDGICENSFNMGLLKHNIEITPDLEIRERVGYNTCEISHGSICAQIIRKYAPDAVLSSIKILNDSSKCSKEQLIKALIWCADNDIKIVNLSLGTIDYKDFPSISHAVNQVYKKGLIIVAAANNRDVFTYPASHTNVIGVKACKLQSMEDKQYIYNRCSLDGIEITACGTYLYKDGEKEKTVSGSSFAAPIITALTYNILRKYPAAGLEEVKEMLRKSALNYREEHCSTFYRSIDWVDQAVLFCPKVHKKRDFYPLFHFKIEGPVYMEFNNAGKWCHSVLTYLRRQHFKLKNTDTVILDLVGSRVNLPASELSVLIEEIAKLGKNILCLEEEQTMGTVKIMKEFHGLKLWHPSLYRWNLMENAACIREQPQYNAPLIALYDLTGERFISYVRKLVNLSKGNGYNALGTTDSCEGMLYGLEYTPIITDTSGKNEVLPFKMLGNIYSPDFFIFGTDLSKHNMSLHNNIRSKVNPDVEIIITETFNSCVRRILQDDDSRKIVIFTQDIGIITEKYKHVIFLFAHRDNCYHLLYKHIKGEVNI